MHTPTLSSRSNPAFDLTNQVALVMGCGESGIAIARALGHAGAKLIVSDPDGARSKKTESELHAQGLEASTVAYVLEGRDDALHLAEKAISTQGRVDILVNAVEDFFWKPATEITPAEWNRSINLQLKAVFWMCQAAGKHMLQRGSGSIINLSSLAGSLGFSDCLSFAASKGGVDQITRTLGVEWIKRGVRVNAIAIWSDGLRLTPDASWLRRTPLGRLPEPDEIGTTAVYLASGASAVLAGQILKVDGGYSAQ